MEINKLYHSVCNIDENFLLEFDNEIEKKRGNKQMLNKTVISAACLILLFGAGFGIAKSGVFKKNIAFDVPVDSNVEITFGSNIVSENEVISNTQVASDKTNEKSNTPQKNENVKEHEAVTSNEGIKGGDTPEILQNYSIASDGVSYYRVFHPAEDKFEPIKDMTLENRFCSFVYNKRSYSLAPDSDITKDDCEPKALSAVISSYWENRSMNPDKVDGIKIKGIEYRARIDIYKLKGVEPSEAVAGLISFNGETKLCRYNATNTIHPSETVVH